jgi:hypothetical protein
MLAPAMADNEQEASQQVPPQDCMPCRGSGHVVSHLGGTESQVTCPWCGGSGMRTQGVDAQASWLAERATHAAEDGGGAPAEQQSV